MTGGGTCRRLSVIPLGPKGYAVPYLKCTFGAATVYIRPVQSNLDCSDVKGDDAVPVIVNCLHYCADVPLNDLRDHQTSDRCIKDFDVDSTVEPHQVQMQNSDEPTEVQPAQDSQPSSSHCTSPRDFQAEVGVLHEMFPTIPVEELDLIARRNRHISEAVEDIMGQENKMKSIEHILAIFRQDISEDAVSCIVDRENIWCYALAFYKKMNAEQGKLNKKMVVSFEGEEGLDAGALSD